MKGSAFLMFLSGIMTFSSCQDDEYVYPSVLTEFVDISTSPSGKLTYIHNDDGMVYKINERSGLEGFTPDSIYRAISIFEPESDKEKVNCATMYSCQFVISAIPIPEESLNYGIKTDPLDIDRIWRSGKYINLILDIMAKNKAHRLNFIMNGVSENNDGSKTLNLTIYHDCNGDYEAYTKKAYASIPLWPYEDILSDGDKIILHINTYKEGMTIREFNY